MEVEGTPRNSSILRDESIASQRGEASHAPSNAKRSGSVEIRYDERQLRLRVRDDGNGIDPRHLKEDGRPGHFGMRGMRERAKLMGGKLAVWSELGSGTEVELRIPASRAYETAPARRRSWLAEKFAGNWWKDRNKVMTRVLARFGWPWTIIYPAPGVAALVGGQADMSVVAEASNGREAIQQFRAHHRTSR